MTIQEAIKSGKPFKRAGDLGWMIEKPDGVFYIENGRERSFYSTDILATDWEVKFEPITFNGSIPEEFLGHFLSMPVEVTPALDCLRGQKVKVTIEVID